jgi:alanyl-tRNA synthetase
MPTERLYFDDPYLVCFEARVVDRTQRGDHLAVALERSAFYPEGGGQPGDRGTLGGVPVLDTQIEDGVIWHVLDGALEADQVCGEVDWARRHDFMQQHHGQHLLSAALEHVAGARTLSAHLGESDSTIDLDVPHLSVETLAEVEAWTNTLVWQNHPIEARFVDQETLASLSLRKPPGAYERIRVVSVDGVDHSACGGTHPRRTGEVGIVAIRRAERRGDTLRLEFLCGDRVLREYRWKNAVLADLAGTLSVGAREVGAAVERIRADEERSRKALAQAQERLLHYEAAELLDGADRIGTTPVVARTFTDRELDHVRQLARLIADGGGVALLGISGTKAQLVFARAAGLPYDMGALLRLAATVVGGRGGGRPEAAQGGGPDSARTDEAIQHARASLVAQV